MTLLETEDFEAGAVPAGWSTNAFATSFGAGRTGNAMFVNCTHATADYLQKALPANMADGIVGIAVKFAANYNDNDIIQLIGDATHLAIRRSSSTGALGVYCGATLLGEAAVATDLTVWTYLELDWVIDDTLGSVQLTVDGTELISLTGVDTNNGGATGYVNVLRLRAPNLASATDIGVDDYSLWDHVAAPAAQVIGQLWPRPRAAIPAAGQLWPRT